MKRALLVLGAMILWFWVGNWILPDSIFSWRSWIYWEPYHHLAFGGIKHDGDRFACGLGDTHKYLWVAVQHRRWAEIWTPKKDMTRKLYTAKVRHLDGSEQLHLAFATTDEEAKQKIMHQKGVPDGSVFVGFLPSERERGDKGSN